MDQDTAPETLVPAIDEVSSAAPLISEAPKAKTTFRKKLAL